MEEQSDHTDPGPNSSEGSAFDPIAAARALGGVQAQALRTAGELVERLTQLVDGPPVDSANDRADSEEAPRSESARLVDLWAEMLNRVTRPFEANGKARPGPSDRFEVDLGEGLAAGVLTMEWDHATESGRSEVWLTNESDTLLEHLSLIVGPLLATTGAPIDLAVRCDPPVVDQLPARSSRGLKVEVSSSDGMPAGTYRGLAQIDGAPGAWFAIEVRVEAAAGA